MIKKQTQNKSLMKIINDKISVNDKIISPETWRKKQTFHAVMILEASFGGN